MANEFLKLMESDREYILFDGDTLKLYKIPKEKVSEVRDFMEKPRERHFAPIEIPDRLNRLTLCVTSVCNLACKYCYEGEQNCPEHKTPFISFETIQKTIDFVLSQYKEGINCVQFFGGEPLLNVKAIRYTIGYITEACQRLSIEPPAYTIVTNGTLMNDEIHELFNEHFGRVTFSLDGRKEINDANRVFAGGKKGSVYDTVAASLKKYEKDRKYYVDVQMTVTESQLAQEDPEITDFLHIKDLGVGNVQISPLINTKDYQVAERDQYTSRIIRYFQKCYDHEIRNINKSNYYKLLSLVQVLKEHTPSDHYCGAGFRDISVDTAGNIFPCFMFNENPAFIMGNVEGAPEEFLKNREIYLNNTISRNEKCAKCWAHGMCSSGHAGCIGSYYLENGTINQPIDYNCQLTKSTFEDALCKIAKFA